MKNTLVCFVFASLFALSAQAKPDRDDRQDRREDRREESGRMDERQERRDCRQEEGMVGGDKRDCKQDSRDGVGGWRGDDDKDKEKDSGSD